MLKDKKVTYKHFSIILLILLLLIGGFLRLWNLGERSLWVDEVNTVFAAQSMKDTGVPEHPSGVIYNITPLFTKCVSLIYQVLEVDEASSRIPSAIFGILAIILVFYCAKTVFNRSVGLFSVFLMTFSHFEIGWSRVSRPYTLLQVFTLLVVIFFIKGFENPKYNRKNFNNVISKQNKFNQLRSSLAHLQISPLWLLLFIAVLGYSYLEINDLMVFVAGGFCVYIFFMSLVGLYWKERYKKIINKYSVCSAVIILLGVIYFLFSQGLQNDINFFLGYTPPWAVESSPVTDNLYLFNFLISSMKFPIAVFFFLGCVQLMSHRNRLGWILLWVFIVPLFLLSLVFTHRAPRYLFFVYPFFLIISSYGFINIVQNEFEILKKDLIFKYKWLQYCIIFAFFIIFLISPWFRFSLKIPFQGDGVTNGAVTTDEWKEAAGIVKYNMKMDDIVITSLPQVAYYYNVKSDYGLNWINLNRAEIQSFKNDTGHYIDIYAGIPCIASLDELKQIVESNERGWIIITQYHFEHTKVIPEEVREYIETEFNVAYRTKKGTILIYLWKPNSE